VGRTRPGPFPLDSDEDDDGAIGRAPPPAGTPGPLSRPTPAAIGGLLEGGGFSEVAVEQDEVTLEFDSPEHFTAYIRAISAPIRAMIEQHAGEAQEEAWDAIAGYYPIVWRRGSIGLYPMGQCVQWRVEGQGPLFGDARRLLGTPVYRRESVTPLDSAAVICADCGAGNPYTNAYCGDCGKRIVRGGDGVTLHPGFKGPRRLLIGSGVVFAVSASIAVMDFLLINLLNPASVGLDLGGPIFTMLLEGVNVTSVRAPGSPSDAVSFLIVGTFLLASLLASASAVSGVAGGIWLLVRWRDGDGPSRVGAAVATVGEASRKHLEDAHKLGAESLEKAKPKLAETAERSRAAAEHARASAAERYEDVKPIVSRVARDGRVTFSEEVAPRVVTGFHKGATWGREWFRARRDKDRDGSAVEQEDR
jgi:hypothetical protein